MSHSTPLPFYSKRCLFVTLIACAVLSTYSPQSSRAQGRPSIAWMLPGFPENNAPVAYAPNGKAFAVSGWYGLYIYTSAGALQQTVPVPGSEAVSAIAWSPDSTTVAVAFESPNGSAVGAIGDRLRGRTLLIDAGLPLQTAC